MSKLDTIRTALQNDSRMQIVSAIEHTFFPNPNGYWTHTVDFVVAPNRGLYTATELQAFMTSLVPGLTPTTSDRFSDWDTSLEFGKLYFDEDIGKEIIRHEITLTEFDFLPAGVVENGRAVLEEERRIRRRTWVRLYPDIEIAMLAEKYSFQIPRTDLNAFKQRSRKIGFIKRIGDVLRA